MERREEVEEKIRYRVFTIKGNNKAAAAAVAGVEIMKDDRRQQRAAAAAGIERMIEGKDRRYIGGRKK